MRHLIVSREFPPAAYPPGGIGTYTANIARLLAEAGEVVHVIGERWAGAPLEREERCAGRLIVHRVSLATPRDRASEGAILRVLSPSPSRQFAWQAGVLAEHLVETEGIDLIEAPEWDAPLGYFLERRALGLGPDRQPPCVLHLHSPTALIVEHNEWPVADFLTTIRAEAACLAAADAMICPSRYLAREAARRFGVPTDNIRVIPYPVGDALAIARGPAQWESHRIAYVGRLEPRKGVIEFIDAAVAVARIDESAHFDFMGDDVPYRDGVSVRQHVERRIPAELQRRFRFHRAQSRARVNGLLAQVRAAVVPSRWENFPYSAIEAMASGLPVIASPNGGMTEVITDEVSGWVATTQTAGGLAAALRRALAASPARCEAMGREARAAIERSCGNATIVARHLEFRSELVRRGASRSLRLPEGGADVRMAPGAAGQRITTPDGGVIAGIVLRDTETDRENPPDSDAPGPTEAFEDGTPVYRARDEAGLFDELSRLARDDRVFAVAIVDAAVRVSPDFLSRSRMILEANPSLAIVTCWIDDGVGGFVRPRPAFPYQWFTNDVAPVALIARAAIAESLGSPPAGDASVPVAYAFWRFVNAVLGRRWTAVTIPDLLARVTNGRIFKWEAADPVAIGFLNGPLPDALDPLAHDGTLLAQHGVRPGIVRLVEPGPEVASRTRVSLDVPRLTIRQAMGLPFGAKLALVTGAARRPRRAVLWLRARMTAILSDDVRRRAQRRDS